ncbi:MAG: translation initiation factor [Candidatus Sumerlaeaceae bacterium]|nr:translation initiation factor [Candidatus Sumerlaeaceae bacterium]
MKPDGRNIDSDSSRLVYSTDLGDLRKATPPKSVAAPPASPNAAAAVLRLETKGRRGKAVTRISRLGLNPAALQDLCRNLKTHCGAGGTVEDADILIQGDHREKIAAFLRHCGHKVK